jgi:hypothetical protein
MYKITPLWEFQLFLKSWAELGDGIHSYINYVSLVFFLMYLYSGSDKETKLF